MNRMISTRGILAIFALALCCQLAVAVEKDKTGLVLQYDFDEGSGNIARDSSGNGADGDIHGGKWVKLKKGYALEFDGTDDYVVCKAPSVRTPPSLITVETWVRPQSRSPMMSPIVGWFFTSYLLTYNTDGNCAWYVGHGANHLRGPMADNQWCHLAAVYDGTNIRLYRNGQQIGVHKSKNKPLRKPRNLLMGCTKPGANVEDKAYHNVHFFSGMIGAVRIYNRALSTSEVASHFRSEAADYGVDTTWLGKVKVEAFSYPYRGEVLIELDYRGLLPVPAGSRMTVSLANTADPKRALWREIITKFPARAKGVAEVSMPIRRPLYRPGTYEIKCHFSGRGKKPVVTKTILDYPLASRGVASPAKKTVGPLPPAQPKTAYKFKLCKGGGFKVNMKGRDWPIQSQFSFPNGGENHLSAAPKPAQKNEPTWKVETLKTGKDKYVVTATGKYYRIERSIQVQATRVSVKDTFTNISSEDIGIIVRNQIDGRKKPFDSNYLSGWPGEGRRTDTEAPSVFVTRKGQGGIALVPLDDVYIIQAVLSSRNAVAELATEQFALAKGASYSLEWAVYPTGRSDYYDFLNTVRKDEDRIGTIDGGQAFITANPMRRRMIPSEKFVSLRNARYGVVHVLGKAADDPEVTINGVGFMDFPKERAFLRRQTDAIRRRHPTLRPMLHIAHALYMTNRPERFADSRVIDVDGKHVVWPYPYLTLFTYISERRAKAGWRWYIFYPTSGNSFHRAMMDSVDVLMDEMGFDGAFLDGFMSGYGNPYTYSCWDGHSADIDPKTKTITRKKGSVLLMSQPSLVEYCRAIRRKGGYVIANKNVMTRTMSREKYIYFVEEVRSGPQAHMSPTVTTLADPIRIHRKVRGLYSDILEKLRWGTAFVYYEEGDIDQETLASQMYPITFAEIRSGLIRGPRRVVTMNSGVYGWPGDRNLHFAYHYDARGGRMSPDFDTTVDRDSVRTEVALKKNESAVVKKIPITLEADNPVNLRVERYDAKNVSILLNGDGQARLVLKEGDFPIKRERTYDIVVGTKKSHVRSDRQGVLAVPITMKGETIVTIVESSPRQKVK